MSEARYSMPLSERFFSLCASLFTLYAYLTFAF